MRRALSRTGEEPSAQGVREPSIEISESPNDPEWQ